MHAHTAEVCERWWTTSLPPTSLQLPFCHKSPLSCLLHVGVGSNQNTWWLFIQWGLMKRYSADFNTFLLCSLFLRAGRESTKISNISNRSSWPLRWANMWHRGYSRQYACVQLSPSEIIFCVIKRDRQDIPMWPHPCSYESSLRKN